MVTAACVLLGVAVVLADQPRVTVKLTRNSDIKTISRELENEAISEEESLKWLGWMHYKDKDQVVTSHLKCDACFEIRDELEKALLKVVVATEGGKQETLKEELKALKMSKFCSDVAHTLRLVLDTDNVALPKYGRGKKTCVFGGWPKLFMNNVCAKIMSFYSLDTFVDNALKLRTDDEYPDDDILQVCQKKYRCPIHSTELRLENAHKMKDANYTTAVPGSASQRKLRPEAPRPFKSHNPQGKILQKLREEFAGMDHLSDLDLLAMHHEKRNVAKAAKRIKKLYKEASERAAAERKMHERLNRKKREALAKQSGKPANGEEDAPLVDPAEYAGAADTCSPDDDTCSE